METHRAVGTNDATDRPEGDGHRSNPVGQGPLHGVRVVEVGVWHAGPGAGAILADLGADVVKVETLEGEPERYQGNFGPMDNARRKLRNWSTLYEFSNRNKKSVTVDFTTPDGRAILDELIARADVFVTNLRAPTKAKLGLEYESLLEVNPHLIHVNVSGFGKHGPMARAGGWDPLGQAISGMMYISGDEEPSLVQMIILDQLGAIAASHAAVTALFARGRDGGPQEVHTSLYGSAVWLTHMNILAESLMDGKVDISWDRRRNPVLRTTFRCGDGRWLMGTSHPEEKYWKSFCEALGRPDLAEDPRYATVESRGKRLEELYEILDACMLTRSREEWLTVLAAHGVMFAPVNSTKDVLTDEQAAVNNYMVDFEHRALGLIRIPGFPIEFSDYEAGPRAEAPELGEHTVTVLEELGREPSEIERLLAEGVIGEHVPAAPETSLASAT